MRIDALKTHWVMIVMDQFTRRIIGFAVHVGDVNGIALCRMFNEAVARMGVPRSLSTDNDPLFEYHRWQANLRVLGVEEVKTVPYVPLSHPFIERLIGTTRREFLDYTLFWNAGDLEREAQGVRGILQPASRSRVARGMYAGANQRRGRSSQSRPPPVPVAGPLPGPVRTAHGCVIRNSPCTGKRAENSLSANVHRGFQGSQIFTRWIKDPNLQKARCY